MTVIMNHLTADGLLWLSKTTNKELIGRYLRNRL